MTTHDEPRLRRAITRRMLFVFILGDILGAGIYALVGEVAAETGGAIWTGFTAALVLALFTAFAYAELITKYPHAGGAALFVQRAFDLRFVTFMVAFAVICSGVTSAATLATAFGGDYFREFVDVPSRLVSVVFILVVAVINFRGISESVRVNMALTFVEVSGIVLVIVIGLWGIGGGDADVSRNFELKEGDPALLAILGGAALAFYALIGFEDSANVAEEAQDPVRNYPPALFAGILAAGAIYFLVTFTASAVVPTDRLAGSDAPLLEVVEAGSSVPLKLFSAIALLAVANGALINLVMASRLLYGMAREQVVPSVLGTVHPRRRTPWVAIVFTAALAGILVTAGSLQELAATTVTLLLMVFVLVNVACLVLRKEPVDHAHFVSPRVFPVLGIAVSLVLLAEQVADDDARTLVLTGGLLVLGVVLWFASRAALRREVERPG